MDTLDLGFVSEAVSPNDLSEMSLFTRKVFLPRGEGDKGYLIYLYTTNVEDTIKEMNNRDNFVPLLGYTHYFYNLLYSGYIRNKRFYIKDVKERQAIYDKVKKEANKAQIPSVTLAKYNRNTYFEMAQYLKIFYNATKKFPYNIKVPAYWDFLSAIYDDQSTSHYKKFLIINAENFENAFSGDFNERLYNPIFMIYYSLLKYPKECLKFNHDIYIFYKNKSIMVNPAHLAEKAEGNVANQFRILITRLIPHKTKEVETATSLQLIQKEETKSNITNEINSTVNRVKIVENDSVTPIKVTMADESDATKAEAISSEDKLEKEIEKKVDKALDKTSDEEEAKRLAEEDINRDKQLLEELYKKTMEDKKPTSSASTARDKQIREQQEKLMVNGLTIEKIRSIQTTHMPITTTDLSKSLTTTNENVKKMTFANYDKDYVEKVMPKDILNTFLSLNDKSIPMTIIKYTVEDTSDELNYKDTYRIELEDVNRKRHNITVDIPKFIDNRYIYVGGGKKIITYQNFLMPVVKYKENEVQIVTNYNKMFITRIGTKSISSLERLKTFISKNEPVAEYFTPGYTYRVNADYITTIEYDELSKQFSKYESDSVTIYFSQEEALEAANGKSVQIGDKDIFIGFENGKPIFIDQDTQKTDDERTISDIIIESLDDELKKAFESTKAPKRLMYSAVTTMRQQVALGPLLGYWEGLSAVMKCINLKYRLERSVPKTLKSNESFLQFKDCVLVYEENVAQSLLMNGFRIIETKQYNILDLDTKDAYMDYLVKVYGKRNIVYALDNTYDFTIDPITYEILEDQNLPTKMLPLCAYANSLLADSQFTYDYNQSVCRLRTAEIIPAILYDAIAKEYVHVRNSSGRKKLSLPRDIVIKNLLKLPTVSEVSTLSPMNELEEKHLTQYKGWRGINNDDSYTIDKRVYDKSMIGIIGLATSTDGQVGVHKILTMEPNITSVRGYTKVTDEKDLDKLKDVNLFGPAESLIPMAATKDDPTRTGHAVKQAKHVVPVLKSSPVLVSNGVEEVVRFELSSDFIINADQDGEVVEYDKNSNIMICKYKDGTSRAIDLNPRIVKNGGGGFYLSNILITNLQVGDKFKKNDCLAWHKDFFKHSRYNNTRLTSGTLAKVAIMSTYNTYNDSTVITEKLSKEMSTEMAFNKQVVVGKNSTVDFICNIGDHIEVGSSLIQFDTSFEDDELNKLLSTLSNELQEGIAENSRTNIKSKISGVVEDIKIYSTVELDELSPSLREIVSKYYKKINNKKKLLEKYDPNSSIVKCGILLNEATGKVTPNKYGVVKGQKMEDGGVLFEFYLKHQESMEVGSKCTYFAGLKTTVGEVIPAGYEPYSELEPSEEISSFIASNSILKRMVPSLLLTTYANKQIIYLKRRLEDMYQKRKDDETMKSEMTSLIYKFFDTVDKSKTNGNKYRALFEPMSPSAFKSYMKGMFEDDDAYLILDIVDYERTLTMEELEKSGKVIDCPFYEYVYLPHVTMDKGNVIRTRVKVPVGFIHIKRTQQTVNDPKINILLLSLNLVNCWKLLRA